MLHTSHKKTLLFVALISIFTVLHADVGNNINNWANNTSATPPSPQSNAGTFAVEAGSIAGAVQSCGQDVSVFSGRVGEAISKLSQNDADRVAAMILYQRSLQQAQQTQINLHPLACSQVASDFMNLPIMKDDYEQTIIAQLNPATNPLAPQQAAAATSVAQQPPTNQPWVNAAATVANNITAATAAPNTSATNSAPKLAQNYNDPNTGQTIPNSATPNMPEPPVNLPPENFPGETPNVGLPPASMKQADPNMAANSNAAPPAMNQTNNQAPQTATPAAAANPYLPPQANNTVQQTPQSQQMVQGNNS